MKKKIIYLLIITIALVLPNSVKAFCPNAEMVKLQKIASNITYDYTYQQNGNNVTFTINLNNIRPEIYVYDFYSLKKHYGNTSIPGYQSGKTISFIVRARGGICSETELYTFYVNLPQYNKFYTHDICEQAKEYKLCNKWFNNNDLNEQQFKDRVQTYINNRDKRPVEEIEEPEITWQEKVFEFVSKYYLFILIPLAVIPTIAIIVIKRKEGSKFS